MPFTTEPAAVASGLGDLLAAACARVLPLLVADPDVTYPYRGGTRRGAGWLGEAYRALGGRVLLFGKPEAAIFSAALALSRSPDPRAAIMIGDNLDTDIRGATRAGMASLLVLGRGVHALLDPAELARTAMTAGVAPTYMAAGFTW